MADDPSDNQSEVSFETSRKEARRAAWALNSLVVLSALAGAFFFGYVLYTIQPFGGREAPPVEIPVSSAGSKVGMLLGESDGVSIMLQDIDEAPTYREQLSEVMRNELGIEKPGRLYVLEVRNDAEATLRFAPTAFTVTDRDAENWTVRWLGETTSPDKATTVGKLRLTQSAHQFELKKGEKRQLFVFIESGADLPPSAEDFVAGTLKTADGAQVALEHTEVKVAAQ